MIHEYHWIDNANFVDYDAWFSTEMSTMHNVSEIVINKELLYIRL